MVENGRQSPSRLITVTLNLDTGEMEGGCVRTCIIATFFKRTSLLQL